MTSSRTVRIIGVPMDLGASRRGVDMGPYAVRVAGLKQRVESLGYRVVDDGNVPVKIAEQMDPGNARARFLEPIREVCAELVEWVEEAADVADIPLVIGGDHSIAMGSLAGVSRSYRKRGRELGLIWFDAHADFNTPETTTSGNIHGMPLAALMGYGLPELTGLGAIGAKFHPEHVVHIGGRDIERGEGKLFKESGILVFTMRDIDERGMATIMKEALARATHGTDGFAASIDMDGFDPDWSPGVGTPVKGGMSYREAHLAMEMIADSGRLAHIDVVEINPLLDLKNQTSERAVELVASALGKQIL